MPVAIPPSVNGTPTLADPAGHLAWELGITGAALVLLGLGLFRARRRQSPRLLLMVLGAASASWQETYGDWGAYVRYSDRFLQFGWPSHLWVASVRCWWFIAGYAVFYPALYGLLTLATGLVRRRLPRQNLYVAAVLLAFPVFYVFDLLFEGTATYLGYWRYLHAFGPALHLGSSSFPLVWPTLHRLGRPRDRLARWPRAGRLRAHRFASQLATADRHAHRGLGPDDERRLPRHDDIADHGAALDRGARSLGVSSGRERHV